MDKLLINGGKKEVKRRNRAMAGVIIFMTDVLGVSDLARIVATYMFGSELNIPKGILEQILNYGLADEIHIPMHAGDIFMTSLIFKHPPKWSIYRKYYTVDGIQNSSCSGSDIEFDDMVNFVLFGRSAVISNCVASCGYDRDVAGKIVSRIYDEIFARYRKIDDISSDSE